MALRNIVTDEDPILRKVCRPVGEVTPRIQMILDDMVETMRDANGVGLAAPQVGVLAHDGVCERIDVVQPGNMVLNLVDAMTEPRQPPALHHRGHALLGNAKFPRLRGGYYAIVVLGHRPNLFVCRHVNSTGFTLPFANSGYCSTNQILKSTP